MIGPRLNAKRTLLHYSQKAYSVAKIEFPEVNDENGKPRKGGLMDPMMGSKYQPSRTGTRIRRSPIGAHSDRPEHELRDLR